MKATIVDLRYRMSDVMRAIDRGETVTILYRGKAKAKLTPIDSETESTGDSAAKVRDQPFFGMWSDREDMADPVAYVRRLRAPRQFADVPNAKKRLKDKRPK